MSKYSEKEAIWYVGMRRRRRKKKKERRTMFVEEKYNREGKKGKSFGEVKCRDGETDI